MTLAVEQAYQDGYDAGHREGRAEIARLTRERDAEKADAAKWFAEYMALSHKQKGPVPDAALQARIAELTRERDEARLKAVKVDKGMARAVIDGRERIAKLEAALRDAEKRLRGAGMLGGSDDPIVAAIRALKEPT